MAQFDGSICQLHDKRITDMEKKIGEIKRTVYGDNGNKGHSMRIHDMESYLADLKEIDKERKETTQRIEMMNIQNLQATKRSIYVYFATTFVGMLIIFLLTHFIKG